MTETSDGRTAERTTYTSRCGSVTRAAQAVDAGTGACCDSGPLPVAFGPGLYGDAERDELPPAAVAASLGCGNPWWSRSWPRVRRFLISGPAAGST